jgi:queuine/archaeosine tRNA-ribosyltransferase
MDSPLLWIGEFKRPLKRNRETDFVMDSCINYYRSSHPRLAYKAKKLFLDSGAYTARRLGIELMRDKIIEIQELLMPDKAVPLDYPFMPGISVSLMRRLWEKTKENIIFWQTSTKLKKRIVPVLHSWNKRSLISNLKWLQREADADVIMFGSLVNPNFNEFSGFFGDRQPRKEIIDMIFHGIEAVKRYTDFKVHITGFGSSPLTLHIAYYLGAESTDSAGYRRKAAYGKIILPGTGERYVSNRSANFGVSKIDDPLETMWLERCKCPICASNPELLLKDWKARAIHNEYVIKMEWQKAQNYIKIGEDAYETYLDRIFARSGLNHLWKYIKLRKKYAGISQSLFGGML